MDQAGTIQMERTCSVKEMMNIAANNPSPDLAQGSLARFAAHIPTAAALSIDDLRRKYTMPGPAQLRSQLSNHLTSSHGSALHGSLDHHTITPLSPVSRTSMLA